MAKFGVATMVLGLMLVPEIALAQGASRYDAREVGAPMLDVQPMVGRGVRYDAPRPMPRAPMAPMASPTSSPTTSPMTSPMPMATTSSVMAPAMQSVARAQTSDRWSSVPGGWQAYRRPTYGYTLPSYWASAPYYLQDYGAYGLSRPGDGFGWSRYYDDAVLTDQYGRVYESRQDVDWSRDERREDYSDSYGYRDEAPRDRRASGGTAGTVIGGIVGGVAGSAIAGPGNRVIGGLVGGAIGAVAGNAIGTSSDRRYGRDSGRGDGYRYEGRSAQRGRSGNYSYDGRWTGSWDGGPVRTFDGRFDGDVRTHWTQGGHDGRHHGYAQQSGYGYSDYGYSGYGYGGGTTVTTVVVQPSAPIVTRSVSYVTDYVHVAAPRRHVRHVKRVYRPKPRCVC